MAPAGALRGLLAGTLAAAVGAGLPEPAGHHGEPAPTRPPPEVELTGGRVVGRWNGGVREFLGVPFAAPPVGARRWLPPAPVAPWAPGTVNATQVAAGCIRTDTWYSLNPVTSEDCLYLNLWAPPESAQLAARPAPVMVWVFGGGYFTGSGDCLQTRGVQLVRTFGDVVVLTFNYRLGVLGWLGSEAHRRYTFERTGVNSTGNMGFLDQVMLLQWVRDNVRAFGGDPNNVLLFGESAGAGAISAHVTSPLSRGLFHRAAMESGAFNHWVATSMRHATDNFNAMVKSMRRLSRLFHNKTWASSYQCAPGTTDVQCLLESDIPGKHLMQIGRGVEMYFTPRSSDWDGMQNAQWAPTVDGVALSDHPFQSLWKGRGHWNEVPVIIGANVDEGTEFMDACRNSVDEKGYPTCRMSWRLYEHLSDYWFNERKIRDPRCFQDPLYREWIKLNWGAQHVDPLFAIYNSTAGGPFSTNYWAAETLVGDYIMHCTQRRAALLMSVGEQPVFEYSFARTPNEEPFGKPPHERITDGFGACHGCEIPFVFFRNDSKEFGITGRGEVQLGLAMSSYWTNFAWSGDPNERAGRWSEAVYTPTVWPRVADGRGPLLLNATNRAAHICPLTAAEDVRAHRCDAFWQGYFESTGWFRHADGPEQPPWDWQLKPRRLPGLPEEEQSWRPTGPVCATDLYAELLL